MAVDAQSDIADFLGTMASGPMLRENKVDQILRHLSKVGVSLKVCADDRHLARAVSTLKRRARRLDPEASRAPSRPDFPGLLPAPPQAEEGQEAEEGVSKFAEDIQVRILVINRMIPGAKAAERRKLQRERADLEDKLRRAGQ